MASSSPFLPFKFVQVRVCMREREVEAHWKLGDSFVKSLLSFYMGSKNLTPGARIPLQVSLPPEPSSLTIVLLCETAR